MTVFKMMGIIYCERYESDARIPVAMKKYVFCFDFVSQGFRRFSIINMREQGSVIRVSFAHLFDYIKPANFYTRLYVSTTRFETE